MAPGNTLTNTYRMGSHVPPMNDTRKLTTFLILSDTHAFPFHDASTAFGIPYPTVDVVLHCGDLTQIGGLGEYKRTLKMLESIEAEPKLVIAGNHDVSLDRNWCQGQEDEDDCNEAIELMTGPMAKDANITYLTEGTHTFTLTSGATFTIYTSPYTPAFGDYAFMYDRTQDRFNNADQAAAATKSTAEHPIPDNVDIIMTHGPPHMHHDLCKTGNAGCKMLKRALERVKPRMHCFGHIHEGAGWSVVRWGDGDGDGDGVQGSKGERETLLVNAAVMGGEDDSREQPTNMPVVVELDLEQRGGGVKIRSEKVDRDHEA